MEGMGVVAMLIGGELSIIAMCVVVYPCTYMSAAC